MAAIWSLTSSRGPGQGGQRKEATQQTTTLKLFGAHLLSFTAMQQRLDNKILSLKEEGDSSHVNQGYDKFVAKSDKIAKGVGLAMLRVQKLVTKVWDYASVTHDSITSSNPA
jgi:hypothetical protein